MARAKFIISVYLFYIRNSKILLSRRFDTGYKDGFYSLPAGHLKEHETLKEGTVREVYEEIGIKDKPKNYKLVHIMHRKEEDERLDLFFINSHIKKEPENKEPHKCDNLKWFPINKLPKNTIPYIKQAIEKYLKKEIYSEIGWKSKA